MKCFLSSFKLEEDESILRVPILKDRVRSQCSNKNQRILERAREKCADSKAWFNLNVADHAVLWATVQLHAAHSPVQCFHIYIYVQHFYSIHIWFETFWQLHKKSRYPNVEGFNSMIWTWLDFEHLLPFFQSRFIGRGQLQTIATTRWKSQIFFPTTLFTCGQSFWPTGHWLLQCTSALKLASVGAKSLKSWQAAKWTTHVLGHFGWLSIIQRSFTKNTWDSLDLI